MDVAHSTNLSIIVQLVTGIIVLRALFFKLPEEHAVINDLLKLETIVQFVELGLYIFLLRSVRDVTGMAAVRYYDWVVTTPIMLLSTMVYFKYQEGQARGDKTRVSIRGFVRDNKRNIAIILGANLMMLVAGYLGEVGILGNMTSSVAGFVFFGLAFATLYTEYATTVSSQKIFTFMFVVWGMYGVAAVMPDVPKNNTLNLLDIVAKNFFGVFLAFKAMQQSTP